jgi:hypothetical protein
MTRTFTFINSLPTTKNSQRPSLSFQGQLQHTRTSSPRSTAQQWSSSASSSLLAIGSASDVSAVATPSLVFDPILPTTEALVGMGVTVILCVIVSWVWANQVVPVSRTNLAISKSRGEVKEYLEELKASDNRDNQRTEENSSVELKQSNLEMTNTTMLSKEKDPEDASTSNDSRGFERWLFTDWLQDNKSAKKAGRQKEPALPILKEAKWNSGDNPVVVTAAMMVLGVIVTALTERVASII